MTKRLDVREIEPDGLAEFVRDTVAAALTQGTNVTITVDDAGDTITIAASGGGGGALAIDDEGAEVLGAAARMNFVGAGVSVTDAGAGEVTVTIPGGGGGGGGSPTVEGSAIVFVDNAASGTIALPAGVAAGDYLLMFTGHGYATSGTPSGWMNIGDANGSGANGSIFYKLADGTESGTSVTVNFGGAYYGEIAVVVVRGGAGFRDVKQARSGGGTDLVVPTAVTVSAGDLFLAFGFARATNTTVTCDVGTVLVSRSADSNAGAALSKLTAAGGPQLATFTSSVGTAGMAVASVAIRG